MPPQSAPTRPARCVSLEAEIFRLIVEYSNSGYWATLRTLSTAYRKLTEETARLPGVADEIRFYQCNSMISCFKKLDFYTRVLQIRVKTIIFMTFNADSSGFHGGEAMTDVDIGVYLTGGGGTDEKPKRWEIRSRLYPRRILQSNQLKLHFIFRDLQD